MATLRGEWSKLSTAELLQRSSQSVAAIAGRLYIFGGELKARNPRDSEVFSLDIKSHDSSQQPQICTTTSTKPIARVGSTSTAINDKLYIFSGRGGEAMTPIDERGAFQVFDTASSSWTSLLPVDPAAAVPEPRSYHCAATDGRNLIYIHAGCPEQGRLRDLWCFEIDKRVWTKLADAPAAPRGGTSIALQQSKLYRMNGFDGNAEIGGLLDVYDPAKNAWTIIEYAADGKAGPGARSVSALLAVNLKTEPHLVTLFGEADPSSLGHAGAGKMLSDAWAFNIGSKTWAKLACDSGEQPVPRGWFDAATIANGKLAVTGGLADTNERIADAWVLSISSS